MLRRAVLAFAFLAPPLSAQRPAGGDSVVRWVDSVFAPFASRQSPGCAVGVSRSGKLVLAKGYGMADLEHDTPITPATRFYIASVSKQFTAMAVVLLAQDGRLSLDDSIQKWVPEVPSFGSPITLRHLLQHTSGLRDYLTLLAVAGWPSDGPLTEQQFLSLVRRQKSLNFPPGDEFSYSNTGYTLLSIVVHRASGKTLRDYAAERIFKPLGMLNTEFRDDHTTLIPQRALGYQPVGSTYRLNQPEFDVVGDGGVYSTVEDLAKWDANFATGRVGGRQALALLETPGRLNDGQTVHYALGLSVGSFHGLRTFSHAGAYGGYRSTWLRFPDKDFSVITLCNTSSAPPTLAEQVSRLFLGTASETPVVVAADLSNIGAFGGSPTVVDSSGARRRNDRLEQLAGEYYSEELDLDVKLSAREGVLVLTRPRASDLRFVPLTDDLFTTNDKILLLVVRDDGGQVSGFTLTMNRVRDLRFTKR